jgi:sugar phosphate isomerase/epimerase
MFSIREHVGGGGALSELADALAERDLSCLDIAGLTIGADSDRTRTGAEELLGIASALGSRWMQVRVVDEVDDAIVKTFVQCAELFAGAGIGMAVEFSPLTKVRTIADARALLRVAGNGGPGLTGIIVDTWHFFRGDDDWPDLDALDPVEVAFVQFADGLAPSADAGHDTLHRRALAGEGEFDLGQFAASLRSAGFDGPVSVEVLSEEWRVLPVEAFARRTFETTSPYWH